MRVSRTTAAEVAKLAGVSQPTVSRVFMQGSKVSADKQRRVREAALKLGYRPNTLARSLNTGRSRTIGIVLAYLKNPFYTEALEKLSSEFHEHGYHIMTFFASNLTDEVDGVVEDLLAHQVDGIILASVSVSSELTKRLQDHGIPLVLFNRGQENPNLASVTAANFEGGRVAARFLLAGGHKRIAHIAGWQKSLNGRERQAGFLAEMSAQGTEPFHVVDCEYSRVIARKATLGLFEKGCGPDSIFVGNDHMAFAVLETLKHELGLDVPGDVSVIGYDDVAMAAWKTFDLTTMRQPANRMAEATVRMLLSMIDDPEPSLGRIEIESQLIVRGSTRNPPDWQRDP
ncbi:LacI family DNA-binding transcriptional regulator [uncultured Ruegeria sp.]|uniref:LacI family DNA-binding transcriptional regulator n=1 Tax=uncultured Ruegeria sp. TaxID=259304 RepID=UPI002612D542|nr:LacI family DNA-binding transcriptional regulator [uncultured Ruegeria sp.]